MELDGLNTIDNSEHTIPRHAFLITGLTVNLQIPCRAKSIECMVPTYCLVYARNITPPLSPVNKCKNRRVPTASLLKLIVIFVLRYNKNLTLVNTSSSLYTAAISASVYPRPTGILDGLQGIQFV